MRSIGLTVRILCIGLLAVLLAACATATPTAPTPVPPTPTALQLPKSALATEVPAAAAPTSSTSTTSNGDATGAVLYQMSCAACHGQDRAGSTFDVDGQKISVPSLAWDELNATYTTQPSRGSVTDQLALSITRGQSETGEDLNPMMPRWSSLSQAQVDSLIQYLQNPNTTGTAAPTNDATNLTGEQLYAASCAACHGADGAGKAFEMDGNKISTPSLHWGDLTSTYSTDPNRGTVAQQVALGITKGLDETGGDLNPMMPRWSSLSQTQVDSLVQYLQTAFP